MDVKTFKTSLNSPAPPGDLAKPLTALWHAAKRDWQKAIEAIKGDDSTDAAWVRAHMNRAQGKSADAEDWYRKANRPLAKGTVDQEIDEIAAGLLLGPGGH